MNWSLRTRIAILLTTFVLIPIIVVGILGYWTSSTVIRKETIRAVGLVASTKKELLVFRLSRQKERSIEFLESIQSTCLNGKKQMNLRCVKQLINSFMKTDSIIDLDITIPGVLSFHQGPNSDSLRNHQPFSSQQLAQFSFRSEKTPTYIVEAHGEIPGSLITARYDTKIIEDIFSDPIELGASGETFLADKNGFFLTQPKYPGYQGESHPIDAIPMVTCLAQHNSEMLAGDYRPEPVIHGFRYIPEIGGGCIMAHIQQNEAFAPLEALKLKVIFLALVFAILAIIISIWIADRFSAQFTQPLLRLGERMKAAQAGDLDSYVSTDGPKEIAILSRGFADLASKLKQSIEVRDDFVSIVSHDLKTPISTLDMSISLLEENIESLEMGAKDKFKSPIAIMRRSLARMTEMIGAILNLTAIRSGNFTLLRERHSVNSLVAEVMASFRPLMAEKNIILKEELPTHEIMVMLDRGRILQVFSNLLGNALKFTPKGGEVTVQVLERENEIQFGVMDSGPGIQQEELEHIFERFHQLKQSGDFSAGLGLYIAKEIVVSHGGKIWAESEVGKGTKFYFTLPLSG